MQSYLRSGISEKSGFERTSLPGSFCIKSTECESEVSFKRGTISFVVYLKEVCLELGECVVVEFFGSCAHCAHSIYSPLENGPGSCGAGAVAAAAVGGAAAADCHSRILRDNRSERCLHSRTLDLCL